jgi:hypothetical protein
VVDAAITQRRSSLIACTAGHPPAMRLGHEKLSRERKSRFEECYSHLGAVLIKLR